MKIDIDRAIRHIVNLRDKNFVTLQEFREEIERNKDSKTRYSTLVYDSRAEIYDLAIKALEEKKEREHTRCYTCWDYDIDAHETEYVSVGLDEWGQECVNLLINGEVYCQINYCPQCGRKLPDAPEEADNDQR